MTPTFQEWIQRSNPLLDQTRFGRLACDSTDVADLDPIVDNYQAPQSPRVPIGWRIAAAIVAVAILTGAGVFYKVADQLRDYKHLGDSIGLSAYVHWVFDDASHPSIDTTKALPLFAVGRTVYLSGRARSDLLERIHLRVTPGLAAGEAEWNVNIPLRPTDDAIPSAPFAQSFEIPADGRLRTVEVVLVPLPEAQQAAADTFSAVHMRFSRTVLNTPMGVVVTSDLPLAGPSIIGVDVVGQMAMVRLRAQSPHGSVIGITHAVDGGPPEAVKGANGLEWRRVFEFGETITIAVPLGSLDRRHELQAYALQAATPSELELALRTMDPHLLKGDSRVVTR